MDSKELQIKHISDAVKNAGLIAMPEDGDIQGFFIAISSNLAAATYSGRKQEYSVIKFRAHMILAAAYCLKAAGCITDIVLRERLRQDRIWGDEFDRKNTANDWHAYVGHYISRALKPGEDYAENMIKACGIAQAAVLMCDRFGAPAPRHYEDLPGAGGHCEHCGQAEGKDHQCPTIVNNVFLDKPKDEL